MIFRHIGWINSFFCFGYFHFWLSHKVPQPPFTTFTDEIELIKVRNIRHIAEWSFQKKAKIEDFPTIQALKHSIIANNSWISLDFQILLTSLTFFNIIEKGKICQIMKIRLKWCVLSWSTYFWYLPSFSNQIPFSSKTWSTFVPFKIGHERYPGTSAEFSFVVMESRIFCEWS